MDYRTGFRDGYNAAREDMIEAFGTEFALGSNLLSTPVTLNELQGMQANALPAPSKKKKTTAYQRKYKKAFKKIAPKHKLKSGKWKKGGFKRAVKAAHKEARR